MKKIQLLSTMILSGAIAFGAQATANKAQVYFQKSPTSIEAKSSIVNLMIDADQAIHGVQFDIKYDPSEIQSITPLAIAGFEVKHNELSPGLMRGLAFSLQGIALPASLPFEIKGNGNVTFKDIILADSKGNAVDAQARSYDAGDGLLPSKTALKDTYPNPFNPISTIKYDLATDGHVAIIIYDATGRLVAELVNQHQTAGWNKSITWNASNQASGMYFAKMVAGSVVETQKLVLLK